MGALTAYVHVRLGCSLCHHGRHAHRSLPHSNRQIYGCTLPAGTKMRRRGVEEGGGRAGKQRRGGPQRYRNKNKIRDDDSEDETKQRKSFGLEMGKR